MAASMRSGIPIVRSGRDLRIGLVLLGQVLSQVRVGAASRREVVSQLEISARGDHDHVGRVVQKHRSTSSGTEAEAQREQYSSAEGEQDEQRPEEVLLARGEGEQDEQLAVGQQLLEVVEHGLSRKNGFFPSGTQEREQGYQYDDYTDEAEEAEFAGAADAPAAKKLRKRKKAAKGDGEERDATGSFVERRDAADPDSAGDGVAEDAEEEEFAGAADAPAAKKLRKREKAAEGDGEERDATGSFVERWDAADSDSAGDGVTEDADSGSDTSSTFLDRTKSGGLLNSCCGDAVPNRGDQEIRKEERKQLIDSRAPPQLPTTSTTTSSTTSTTTSSTTSTTTSSTTSTTAAEGVKQVKLHGKSGTEVVRLKCKNGDETSQLTLKNTAKDYDLPCGFVGVGEEFTIDFTNDKGEERDVFVTDQYKNKEDKDKQPFQIKSTGDHWPVCREYPTTGDTLSVDCETVQSGWLKWGGQLYTLRVKPQLIDSPAPPPPQWPTTSTTTSPTRHHDRGGGKRVKLHGASGTEVVHLKCKKGDETQYTYTLSHNPQDYPRPEDFAGAWCEEFTIDFTNDGEKNDVFVTDQYNNREDNDKQPFQIKHPGKGYPSCPEYTTSGESSWGACGEIQSGWLKWGGVYTLRAKP